MYGHSSDMGLGRVGEPSKDNATVQAMTLRNLKYLDK